ncbi:SH3 domain-containing protein [Brevibacillus agri]|uniref:SH3 domain-containing protein n=1 Tax=Brevibacillus agri TaxID=51101 RepID=UPI000569A904|nr:SH3 domain-containing protein [Brevibacillus agri]
MKISSYQKSLFVRNVALIVFSVALVAVCVKLVLGYRQMTLYDQAKAYYEANNLLQAEESFARASDIGAISYGDEQWSALMSQLTSIRLEMEGLQQKAQTAMQAKQDADVLETYETYQAMRKTYANQPGAAAAFFQQLSAHLRLEKGWSDYYQQAMQAARGQSQANLDKESYRDESFIDTLLAIPAEYYGGQPQKQEALLALFEHYEKTKLRSLINNASFEEVIFRTASSLRHYAEQSFAADWLLTRLEKYAQDELKEAIRKQDLASFVKMAAAYRKIQDVLPDDSRALDTISDHLKARLREAEQYAKSRQFSKAIELYQELSPLEDTATLVAEVENRWLDYDPGRLLAVKYPDKIFTEIFSGTDLWGAKLYAYGLVEEDQRLYVAAKLQDDSLVYLEHSFDGLDIKSVRVHIADALGGAKAPVMLVQAAGKEREFSYTGLLPDLSQKTMEQRFAIEADEFAVEDAEHAIIKNAVGKGKQEYARFKLTSEGLAYVEKVADMAPDADEAETDTDSSGTGTGVDAPAAEEPAAEPQTVQVFAGPGEEYDVIGEVVADESLAIGAELNGWSQITLDGQEGWIRTPQTAP